MSVLKRFNISYSTYSIYQQSQLQFYFYKIKNNGLLSTDQIVDGYGICGNIIHSVCDEYIKNPSINPDDMFTTLWYEKKIPTKKQLNGNDFDIQRYQRMLDSCIKNIDFLLKMYGNDWKNSIESEVLIEFNLSEDFDDILVKGIIDMVLITNDVYLYDWKTNVSPTYDLHREQRLFYSWLYWKKHDIIPKECRWFYAETGQFIVDSFSLQELLDFQNDLYKIILEIKDKGEDISRYDVGNYDTPFNVYRSLCFKEKNNRKNSLSFGIASWGNVSVLIGDVTPLLQKGIDKELSYRVDGYKFIKSGWDGFVHFFNKKKNAFPTGLRGDVIKVLEQYSNYLKKELELEFKDMTEFTGLIDVPDKLIDVELRDYQKEAVEKFMKSKYSIIKLPTAAGKTYLAAEIIRVVGKRTLWIIDKKLLLFQTKQVFEDVLGVPIGTITEGEVNIEDITICTYQTLVKRIDELRDYLRSIGFLIMDECHHSSKSVQKICSRCPNTSYRLGLSATPDLKNDFLEVKSLVGPVCFELSKDNPRLKDFLSDSRLIFVDIDDEKFQPYDDEPYLDRYRKYIVSNDMRNRTILKLVKRHEGKNILIITKLIEHAEILSEMIGCPNLLGKTKKEDRDKIIQRYKEDGGFVCVGSVQVVSEGWDVPTLDILIQASAPSGPVKTIQGLGRILRRYDGKDLAIYYDFMDRYDRVFKSASRRRQHSFVNEGHKIEEEKIEFK